MKKNQLLILLGLLILPIQVVKADFTDVPKDHEYYEAITTLEDLGVVEGYADGSFGVNQLVNRGEFLKTAYLAEIHDSDPLNAREVFPFGEEASIEIKPPCFSDFTGTEWYEPYVCWGKGLNILSGYPDKTFKAINPVNLAEASKLLHKTRDTEYKEKKKNEHWAVEHIKHIQEKGLIPANIKKIDQPLTRGEATELIWQYLINRPERQKEKPSNYFRWENNNFTSYELIGYTGESLNAAPYFRKDEKIYYGNIQSEYFKEIEAENESFKVVYFDAYEKRRYSEKSRKFTLAIAMDKFGIFNPGKRLEKSDSQSFEVIENSFAIENYSIGEATYGYGKDNENAYVITCYAYKCQIGAIRGADVDSFQYLGRVMAADKENTYDIGKKIENVHLDADSFEFISFDLGKDESGYYFIDEWQNVKPLILLEQTGNNYYFTDEGGKVVYQYNTNWGPESKLIEVENMSPSDY